MELHLFVKAHLIWFFRSEQPEKKQDYAYVSSRSITGYWDFVEVEDSPGFSS